MTSVIQTERFGLRHAVFGVLAKICSKRDFSSIKMITSSALRNDFPVSSFTSYDRRKFS